MFKQFLGSLGARFLPGFGFKPFLPVKLTPVYFPGWIIDAEAEIDTFSGSSQVRFPSFSMVWTQQDLERSIA